MGEGPVGPTRWAKHPTFLATLRTFWGSRQWTDRPRGQLGTPWLEMRIGYEVEHSGVPEREDGLFAGSPHAFADDKKSVQVLHGRFQGGA